MAAVTETGSPISRDPGIHGGRPASPALVLRFAGLPSYTTQGEAPEESASNFGHRSLAQVRVALAYYYANQAEVDADLEASNASTTRSPANTGASLQ